MECKDIKIPFREARIGALLRDFMISFLQNNLEFPKIMLTFATSFEREAQ